MSPWQAYGAIHLEQGQKDPRFITGRWSWPRQEEQLPQPSPKRGQATIGLKLGQQRAPSVKHREIGDKQKPRRQYSWLDGRDRPAYLLPDPRL